MKSPFVVILLLATLSGAFAQQAPKSVAVDFKGIAIAFYGDPQSADPKFLPFIDGRNSAGSKERFGFCFNGSTASEKALEILDKDGQVLKTVSVGELLSGRGNGFSLISQPASASHRRWIEQRYAVDLPKEKVELLLKALATGTSAADQHLVVTFAMKSSNATTLSLRVALRAAGNLESKSGGLLLASKSGSSAIAAAVYPGSAVVGVSKSVATLSSKPVSLEPGKESAILWLVLDGVTGGNAASVKDQAGRILRDKRFAESDPHIVVVSTTDKPSTQPGDVVTYSLLCRNIGTGDATDVTLSNPVSDGLQYLDGSVTSEGSSVTFDQKDGGVRNINWKFNAPIRPGDERLVSFKVRVL